MQVNADFFFVCIQIENVTSIFSLEGLLTASC